MKLTKSTEAAILAHAAAAHPSECCGFVLTVGRKQVYRPCQNIAAAPAQTFEIDPQEWLAAEAEGEVLAVVHSHPQGEPFLSPADRLGQQATGLPWVLCVSGSLKVFRPVPLLRGRVFDYGKADCYSLLADAYHLAGIELPEHERGDMDEDAAQGLFEKLAESAGFVRVYGIQAGDVVLTGSGATAGHAALYLGHGELLHHAYDQLSRREPYGAYWQRHTYSIWRHRDWQPEMLQAVLNDLEAGV